MSATSKPWHGCCALSNNSRCLAALSIALWLLLVGVVIYDLATTPNTVQREEC